MKRNINKIIGWSIATGLCLLGFAACKQFGGNAPRIYGPPPAYQYNADTIQNGTLQNTNSPGRTNN